ncbi:MAG: hypothetical protein QNJ69_14390 [Gammaproteobacteria bacterium]|nr:hypothetical protein [Gammaproteobacteria bacterium]
MQKPDPANMLICCCALHCEAKPLIDHYRLQKLHAEHPFDVYRQQNIAVVVSGIGALNMAAATAWAAAFFEPARACWINLGVAGHQSLAVGELVVASQISQAGDNHSIYPVPLPKLRLALKPVISHAQPQSSYHDDALCDMEAYAFIHSASRFAPLELCHSLKIISDNAQHKPHRDKAAISQLIHARIDAIAGFAAQLMDLALQHARQKLPAEQLQRFLALAHFTQTQQIQLKKLLLGLRQHDYSLDQSLQSIDRMVDSRQILRQLEQQLHRQSEQL